MGIIGLRRSQNEWLHQLSSLVLCVQTIIQVQNYGLNRLFCQSAFSTTPQDLLSVFTRKNDQG
ncbi:hypothetical protein PSPTOT1_2937 [Pseudomonas syringae pv. tomato T1]|nr:hypothetical protein PSPTOT1_2937 [Pseudomonas syringae pv. tomato T1]